MPNFPSIRLVLVALLLSAAALPTGRAWGHTGDMAREVLVEAAIDAQRVELQVMIPLRQALDEVYGGLSLDAYRALDPDEADRRLLAYHTATNTVTIDGDAANPVLVTRRAMVLSSPVPEAAIPPDEYALHAHLFYLVDYPVSTEPGRVTFVWGTFPIDRRDGELAGPTPPLRLEPSRLPVVMGLEALGQSKLAVLSPAEPAYTWHGRGSGPPAELLAPIQTRATPPAIPQLNIPALSLGLVAVGLLAAGLVRGRSLIGAAAVLAVALGIAALCLPYGQIALGPEADEPVAVVKPDDAQAVALFEPLHRNIYRAFDYDSESAIYDALARSVAGPELADIYHDVYASLVLQEEGGAVSKVQEVKVLEARAVAVPDEGRAAFEALHTNADDNTHPQTLSGVGGGGGGDALFAVRCRWTVRGLVRHFGHTHERLNAFEATYTLAPINNGWRIIDTRLHHQQRLDDPAAPGSNTGDPDHVGVDDEVQPDLDTILGTDGR